MLQDDPLGLLADRVVKSRASQVEDIGVVTSSRVGLVAVALVTALAACTPATAPPAAVTAAVAERPDPPAARGAREAELAHLPDVVGRDLHGAAADLATLELSVRVMTFGDGDVITVMHPPGGTPVPRDGVVDLWLGTPPLPPPPPEPAPAPDPPPVAEPEVAAEPSADPEPEPEVAVAPAPAPDADVGQTPGLDQSALPPAPPRTSPTRMEPMEPGTIVSGRASWYGPGFEGRTTACGSIYDSSQLTLASREFRCGTVVRITGPNGTVEAMATDWGPAEWTNRRFDLSRATFAAVAPLGAGVTDVTIEVLIPGP